MQLVVFALGSEEYALPIHQVQEIIRYRKPRRVSNGKSVRGVINLRGRIVPVCDLALQFGVTASVPPDLAGVNEVLSVEESQIESAATDQSDVFPGIAKVDDRLVILIDPVGLVAELGITRVEAAA
jgi:purine-binding chemotaxis protein CheW